MMSIATIEITVTAKPPCNKTYIIHIATLDCQLATRSVHTIAAAAFWPSAARILQSCASDPTLVRILRAASQTNPWAPQRRLPLRSWTENPSTHSGTMCLNHVPKPCA